MTHIPKIVLCIVMMVAMQFSVSGQSCSYSLSGKVIDKGTGVPLSYASVRLIETSQGALAGEQGEFLIGGICPGEYHVQISHVGFEEEKFFVRIEGDEVVNFELHHHDEMLSEVVIHGAAEEQTSQISQSISEENISEESNKNLADVIGNIAGVNIIKNGSGISKPVIHGLYGNRISIVNSGMVQAGQQWGNDHAPEIDPFFADHISVVKGVSALEFSGNSLGGVVKMEPGNIGLDPHMHGKVNYIFQSNGRGHTGNFKLEKGNGKISWRTAMTWKKMGDTQAPNYYLTNTGKNELNGAFQFEKHLADDWKIGGYYSIFNTEIGILRASHTGSEQDLQEALNRTIPQHTKDHFSYGIEAPKQKVQHHLVKMEARRMYANGALLSLKIGSQLNRRKEFDRRRGDNSERPAMSMNLFSNFMEGVYQSSTDNGLDIKTGIQVTMSNNQNDNGTTGILPLIPQYQSFFPGVFLLGKKQIGPWFYEFGARYDFRKLNVQAISTGIDKSIERFEHTFHNVNVLAGFAYDLNDLIKTSLNFGYTQRAPEVNELYSYGLHQGVSGFEVGLFRGESSTHAAKLEKSLKSTLTWDFRLNDQLFVQALGYYQLIRDYIYLQPSGDFSSSIRGTYQVYNYEQTDARIHGLDFSLVYEPTHDLKVTAKHALVRGWDRNNAMPLVYMPADYSTGSISYSFHNTGILDHLTFELNGRYTYEQSRFEEGQDVIPPPVGYLLLGAKIGSSVSFKKSSLAFNLRGENLTDNTYRDYMNRLRYFADETGINISAGLTYTF